MSDAIKQRILAHVRQKIADRSETYICVALRNIADQDHRRAIQQACDDLRAQVMREIAPYPSVGEKLAAETDRDITMDDILLARIELIDELSRRLMPISRVTSTPTPTQRRNVIDANTDADTNTDATSQRRNASTDVTSTDATVTPTQRPLT
jgi:hypothetical protein